MMPRARHAGMIAMVIALVLGIFVPALAQTTSYVSVLIAFSDEPSPDSRLYMLAEQEMLKGVGGRVDHVFHTIPVIAASVPGEAISLLARQAGVSFVEQDGRVRALDQALPWGVDRIDAEAVHHSTKGEGVKVAVVDSGIDLEHPDLAVSGDVTFVLGTLNGDDDYGHGTHVAGIIAALDNDIGVIGVAPEADIYAVKVLDRTGSGYWSDVAKAIEWSIDHDMDVINMSLGGTAWSQTVEFACNSARDAGMLLVAAAGNSGTSSGSGDNMEYPARFDSVIGVAATDTTDSRAAFSSTGPSVELAAPGVSIYSTLRNGAYGTKRGTSMAAAHVSGVAALMLSGGVNDSNGNGRVNDEARERLASSARDLGAPGRDPMYGYGLVDAQAACGHAVNLPPVANAGGDQTVADADGDGFESVLLDGSGSYDPDGSIVGWLWQRDDLILGSSREIVCDLEIGTHHLMLTVTDDDGALGTDDVTIAIAPNSPPVANAGPDRTVADDDNDGLEKVLLDGTASHDADGQVVSYEWSTGSTSLGSGSTVTASLGVASSPHVVTLTVVDSGRLADSDDVVITVMPNQPPVADAGPDQTATDYDGDGVKTILLNAGASYDPDGQVLSWEWSESGQRLGFGERLTCELTLGVHEVQLAVIDNGGATASDQVTVTVNAASVQTMHVEAIDLTVVEMYGGWRTHAQAFITVVDIHGDPVAAATVEGHWEDATRDFDLGVTAADGSVLFKSDYVRFPTTGTVFTLALDSVAREGWVYDSAGSIRRASIAVGASPTPTPGPTLTPSPAPTATPFPSPTSQPSPAPTPTVPLTPTPGPTLTPAPSPAPTPEPTLIPSPTPSGTPAPTGTPTPTPESVLHVEAIEIALVREYSGWRTYAEADIRVLDSVGNPVEGATVRAHWEGATNDADSGITRPDGVVTVRSNSLRFPASGLRFIVVIDDVGLAGSSYDSEHSQTTAQVAVP
jgi:subtilisin family serine protease